jgi:hypothetical protein
LFYCHRSLPVFSRICFSPGGNTKSAFFVKLAESRVSMSSSVNWPIFLGIIWAITLLGLFSAALCLNRWFTQISLGRALLLVAMVALCVRLIPNLFLPMGAGYDIESYQIVGNLVLHKENVYTSQEAMRRHPYLPLQMYWMAFSLWFAQTFNLPFVKIVRLAPIFADAGIATWITLRLHNRLPLPSAFRGGLLYALNPITVFVSAYHGQFDAIPVLLTLVAIEMIEVSPLGSWCWVSASWTKAGRHWHSLLCWRQCETGGSGFPLPWDAS